MKLGIIGCGAIGTDVARAADTFPEIKTIYLHDIKPHASRQLVKKVKKGIVKTVQDFLIDVDVVFEGASQEAVRQYADR